MPRWTAPPAIVAEELVGVPDALLTALHPGRPASGIAVASALARSLAPAEHSATAPSWLLPEQERSFRRVLAALHRHGGALLADPVGSGKTYVALAVASALNRGSTACLVPATLRAQWEATAARLRIPVTLSSHEQISRGRLPGGTRGLVIIDESHHFRTGHTRRYPHLAPWLVGRPVLLVTATPIVNRPSDLSRQLLLGVRDNALAMDGILSIRAMLAAGCPGSALGQIVVEGEAVAEHRPRRVHRSSKPTAAECLEAARLIEMLNRLRLSHCRPIATLIRGVLLRAAGSSPAALSGALRRYRRLLLHARDALQAGQAIDRVELRHFTRELGDQLIWWELLPITEAKSEMALGDLGELEDLIRAADAAARGVDGKLSRLRDMLGDRTPTLVFTASRDTVRYIRDRLSHLGLAWCTGERAGIGPGHLPRRSVLGWFREPTTSSLAPQHLIVTDVAAEGLDLQRAARVIHYDLPWTPMRLEQREGRSIRYGSGYSQVEVVRFASPRPLERLLRVEATLARKVKLPAAAGLGPEGRHIWRWRAELAERFGGAEPCCGVTFVASSAPGLLAGFALYRSGDSDTLATTVLWMEPDGVWTEAPEAVEARLAVAAAQCHAGPVDRTRLRDWLALLARPIRDRLAFTRSRRWIIPDPAPATRRFVARLQYLVRDAARRHDARRLGELDRALAFASGGHTAGEDMLIERLADAPDSAVVAALHRLPAVRTDGDGIEVRLTGLAIFGPAKDPTGPLASPECPPCKPLSSISTAP